MMFYRHMLRRKIQIVHFRLYLHLTDTVLQHLSEYIQPNIVHFPGQR